MTDVDVDKVLSGREHEATVRRLLQRDWRMLIDGELCGASDGGEFATVDPFSQLPIARVPDASAHDVDRAVEAALAARAAWRETTAVERARLVLDFADLVEEHRDDLALLDAIDAGSPIVNARFDVTIALAQMRMFAGLALEMKGQTVPASAALHFTIREPVGVVAKIWPYNHPLMFFCRIAAPLVAGNCVVAKPPEAAPLSPLALGELAAQVFPPGVVNVVVGDGPSVPDRIVRHRGVRRVGFIGSEPTGRSIQKAAAESGVKHVTLELGGKNAMVVFPDVDLDAAAASAVNGMNFTWSGQSCGSTSRLLVHEDVHDALVEKVAALIRERRQDDPLSEASQQGTMINKNQYDKSLDFIQTAQAEGATVVVGGGRPEGERFGDGLFVAATLLTGVSPDSRIAQQEVFGPVLSVITFRTEDEALHIANDVEYGLTASVWSNDIHRALRMARGFEAGFVWVNGSSAHYPNVPYGGVKSSGVGGKEECLEELLSYTEEKAINIL
ncbi:aldehyde dehydrogenase family protein [Microbacterium shaanxiense]